ncbi:hypothetical protein GJAV_G00058130 [Gymnothorax javanicus]|nr:hypothetical protein GJAV_G00058130 [Gymnothorax javanicus]
MRDDVIEAARSWLSTHCMKRSVFPPGYSPQSPLTGIEESDIAFTLDCYPVTTKPQQRRAAAGMARPQTDAAVEGGNGSGGQNGQQSCRMEALRPEDTWNRGGFQSPQTGHQPCRSRRDIATQTTYSAVAHAPRPHMPVCAPSAPPSGNSDTTVSEQTEREQEICVERPRDGQPLPDLLPQRRRPLGEAEGDGDGGEEETEDEVSGRVAEQLRIIGDEMNTLLLQRRNAVQPLQDWRGLCWGLFTLITDTLGTLYLRRNR